MYQTDTDVCLDAMRAARVELSRFINPFESRDAVKVLDRIIDLLDSDEVDAALHRIDSQSQGYGVRLSARADAMSHSVWLYVSVEKDCVKVFASCDSAVEWLRENDPDGAAVEYPVEEEHALPIVPKRSDIQTLIAAFLEARSVLSNYLLPGIPRSADFTVEKLMDALTNDEVLAAIGRMEGRQRFGPVEVDFDA
jgi:hypothetical protein